MAKVSGFVCDFCSTYFTIEEAEGMMVHQKTTFFLNNADYLQPYTVDICEGCRPDDLIKRVEQYKTADHDTLNQWAKDSKR